MESEKSWVETWGMAHAALSAMSFASKKRTLRLVWSTAISGEKIRLRLCNKYAKHPVEIASVTLAPCDPNGSIPATNAITPLTFGGKTAFAIQAGETLVSDEADFSTVFGSYLCANVYVTKGKLTSGNYINSASLVNMAGDGTRTLHTAHKKRWKDAVITAVSKLLGMTLHSPIPLFQAVELLNGDGAASIECFGDSLTQQCFWTAPFEQRIRSLYPGRYSVINKGIGGNRIWRDTGRLPLKGFFGTKALERIQDDIFAYEGIGFVVFCLGINDYLQPGTIAASKAEAVTVEEVARGVTQLADMLRARGLRTVGMNYLPVGLSADATPQKSEIGLRLNQWLETQTLFDAFVDIYTPFVSPDDAALPNAAYIGKDKTHPNTAGGAAIAGAFDYDIFAPALTQHS